MPGIGNGMAPAMGAGCMPSGQSGSGVMSQEQFEAAQREQHQLKRPRADESAAGGGHVLNKEEFEAAQIEGSIHMTAQVGSNTSCVTTAQDLLHQVVDNWDPNELFVIIDHQGEQGPDVATYFLGHGMKQARCLRGGIDAWSLEIDNSVPRYEFA